MVLASMGDIMEKEVGTMSHAIAEAEEGSKGHQKPRRNPRVSPLKENQESQCSIRETRVSLK